MAAKRNTRVYVDEVAHHTKSHPQLGDNPHWSQNSDEEACIASIPRDDASSISLPLTNQASEKEVSLSLPKSDKWLPAPRPSKTPSATNQAPIPSTDGRPDNFGVVLPGVYRSSFPKPENYAYLRDLKLKTIVTLVKKDEINLDFESFLTTNGIRQVVFNMKGTKKEAIPPSTMSSILNLVLNQRNYPLLLHCNHGKHRTGCVVAAVRKTSGWHLDAVLDEYKAFATPKIRECDVDYISTFRLSPSYSGLPRALSEQSLRLTSMQVRSFFRTLLFSTFVITVWMVSGSRLIAAPK
ncbi:Tyrosine-protein phosphatase SIW14 [Escovopsis weberi]|uniref:diphosphoinositol-polyphosphate diphosphatase n=1 Tax=Escovopsis weberi TaxID=150374 RepID=A0A0M8N0Y6_ESCWE|nr:Tyrosine-protein phosphatase SIW14 [Escovopsis weberi]